MEKTTDINCDKKVGILKIKKEKNYGINKIFVLFVKMHFKE